MEISKKNELDWLKTFIERYSPSISFLNKLNGEVVKQYIQQSGREFDVKELFIEFQDDLKNFHTESILKIELRYSNNSSVRGFIYWRINAEVLSMSNWLDANYYLNLMKIKAISPSQDIDNLNITFKLLLVDEIPQLRESPQINIDLFKDYPFKVLFNCILENTEFKVFIEIESSEDVTDLNNYITTIYKHDSQNAINDSKGRYIHQLTLESIDSNLLCYYIDSGSFGNKDTVNYFLKLLQNSAFKILKVIFNNI